eukprot:4561565-Ditylum_brightwellii.AAC.1
MKGRAKAIVNPHRHEGIFVTQGGRFSSLGRGGCGKDTDAEDAMEEDADAAEEDVMGVCKGNWLIKQS